MQYTIHIFIQINKEATAYVIRDIREGCCQKKVGERTREGYKCQCRVTCGYLLAAAEAGPGGHQLRVVLLAHDHAVHHAHAVQDTLHQSHVTLDTGHATRYLVTDRAHVAHLAEVLLADGEVLVGEVLVHHLLPAHLALTTQGFQDTEYICPQ